MGEQRATELLILIEEKAELKKLLKELRTYGLDDCWAENHEDLLSHVDEVLND